MHRFDELAALVAVVETGSFTAAAERLDTEKSAVSRRVAALEDRLGVQLIRRTTRRMNLTDTGRSFYERSARILADVDEAEAAVLQQHGELRGTLKVALPLSFGVLHMGGIIAGFAKRHPRVTFDLDLNDRVIDLVQEGADLALRIGHLRDSSLIARRLFEVRTVVCASPDYLAAHGEPATPDELSAHDCLAYGNLAEPGTWAYTDPAGVRRRVDVRVALRATSGDLLCQAAVQGLGIVLQPTFLAGAWICSGKLVPILTGYSWPVSPAWAVYPPTRHLSVRVREFIDFLAEKFSGVPYWDEECGSPAPRGD